MKSQCIVDERGRKLGGMGSLGSLGKGGDPKRPSVEVSAVYVACRKKLPEKQERRSILLGLKSSSTVLLATKYCTATTGTFRLQISIPYNVKAS